MYRTAPTPHRFQCAFFVSNEISFVKSPPPSSPFIIKRRFSARNTRISVYASISWWLIGFRRLSTLYCGKRKWQVACGTRQVAQRKHSAALSASILCPKSGLPMVLHLGINVVNGKLQPKRNYELTTRGIDGRVVRRINDCGLVIVKKIFRTPPPYMGCGK